MRTPAPPRGGRAAPAPERPPVAPGAEGVTDAASGNELPLPHERDETTGAQATGREAAGPDPRIRQAKRDLDAGRVDTDLRSTPGLDAERRARLVGGAKPPRKRKP